MYNPLNYNTLLSEMPDVDGLLIPRFEVDTLRAIPALVAHLAALRAAPLGWNEATWQLVSAITPDQWEALATPRDEIADEAALLGRKAAARAVIFVHGYLTRLALGGGPADFYWVNAAEYLA